MTNKEFMWRARMQKESAEYLQCQKVNDWFISAFIWIGLIAAGLVLLVLLVFSFAVDFTISPETGLAFLLVCILFNMGRK